MPQLSFVCIGPQKTSTSWLDEMLRQHPDIALPDKTKELFFFDRWFQRGYDWYWSQFGAGQTGRLLAEIAPSYFDDAGARERIRAHNPQIKLIVCLRDPVERDYSMYCHYYARGKVSGSFAEAVSQFPRILDSGDYLRHSKLWAQDFSPAQMLFVRQEDVKTRPAAVLDAVCAFIGIQPVAWTFGAGLVYQRPKPRALWLATLADRSSRILRDLQLHRLIDLLDRLGLRKLVFGAREFKYPPLTPADIQNLEQRHAPDRAWLDALDFSGGAVRGDVALAGQRA